MIAGHILSPSAQLDLDKIWDNTTEHWGTEQAEIYTRQLWQDIKAVAKHPAIGRKCPEVRMDYYKYPSGSHVLFYRLINGTVDIVRILHERMDCERHL